MNYILNQENEETVTVLKKEYEFLKKKDEESLSLKISDFALIVNNGPVVFNDNGDIIEIYGVEHNNVVIDGVKYSIDSNDKINAIKEYITNNLNKLIEWSKIETNEFLNTYGLDGRNSLKIKVKYGQLTICLDGQISGVLRDSITEFVNKLYDIIKNL